MKPFDTVGVPAIGGLKVRYLNVSGSSILSPGYSYHP